MQLEARDFHPTDGQGGPVRVEVLSDGPACTVRLIVDGGPLAGLYLTANLTETVVIPKGARDRRARIDAAVIRLLGQALVDAAGEITALRAELEAAEDA